jgi:pyruvate,water dikinase
MILSHPIKDRDQSKINWQTANISASARLWMKPIYTRARRMRLRREQVSSIYTASYGSFRVLFIALAERLIKRGLLNNTDDIFFLKWPEIKTLVGAPSEADNLKTEIKKRRQEVTESAGVVLPETIYGNSPPPVLNAMMDSQKRKGIPTSPGYYQGPLKIVASIDDFGKVKSGDVIAIPYSDVAWTPLFAKAGAVIAEAGGMLSHSSIVAREYGIPCIVSVSGATNLPQNSMVYVDGYQGEVGVLDSRDSSTIERGS